MIFHHIFQHSWQARIGWVRMNTRQCSLNEPLWLEKESINHQKGHIFRHVLYKRMKAFNFTELTAETTRSNTDGWWFSYHLMTTSGFTFTPRCNCVKQLGVFKRRALWGATTLVHAHQLMAQKCQNMAKTTAEFCCQEVVPEAAWKTALGTRLLLVMLYLTHKCRKSIDYGIT